MRHEFGHHALFLAQSKAGSTKVAQVIQEVTERHVGLKASDPGYHRARFTAINNDLSRYATASDHELVAEAFAEVLSSASPRPFAQALFDAIVPLAEA